MKYKILMGGLGDDAHSIGISLLVLGLKESGFHVHSLGIRNTLKDFFNYAADFEIIMISNKNGHAELYAKDFPALLASFKVRNNENKLWYIGGDLSVNKSYHEIKKTFLKLGFTNVFPKAVPFEQVLQEITKDITRYGIVARRVSLDRLNVQSRKLDTSSVSDRKLSIEELHIKRANVFVGAPKKHSFFDIKPVRSGHSLDRILWLNKLKGGLPLLQPRTGVADITKQTSKLQFLEVNGSQISSVQLDAASRSLFFDKAEEGKKLSLEGGSSWLNGFPLLAYEIPELQSMINSLSTPFQLRAGGPDHRLVYEVALRSGISGLEGGPVCYLMPYDKLTSPVDSINHWQYIDRLCSFYHDASGHVVNREYFGVLTASLIEPSLAIIVNVVQALLSSFQGVRSICAGYAEQGNRIQDIAAIHVLYEMVTKYLKLYKQRDIRLTVVFHQFMSAFPSDRRKAEDLIFNSSITAALAGSTKMMTKTLVESLKIPDRYDNAQALAISKRGIMSSKEFNVDQDRLRIEKQILRKEVDILMSTIIDLGNGHMSKGVLKGIENGIIDIPWSPNIYNMNQVMGVRDIDGAVRFMDFGKLPFTEEIKEFHSEKVLLRKTMERDPSFFSLLEKDLSRIWRNDYKYWPLDSHYVY